MHARQMYKRSCLALAMYGATITDRLRRTLRITNISAFDNPTRTASSDVPRSRVPMMLRSETKRQSSEQEGRHVRRKGQLTRQRCERHTTCQPLARSDAPEEENVLGQEVVARDHVEPERLMSAALVAVADFAGEKRHTRQDARSRELGYLCFATATHQTGSLG